MEQALKIVTTIKELSWILEDPTFDTTEWRKRHPEFSEAITQATPELEWLRKHIITDEYYEEKNGHGKSHIYTVMATMMYIAVHAEIRMQIAFDYEKIVHIAAYHDMSIKSCGKEHHERFSAIMFMLSDRTWKTFFQPDIMIIVEAILSHRFSKPFYKAYGNLPLLYQALLRDSDRSLDVGNFVERCYQYYISQNPDATAEAVLDHVLSIAEQKYGRAGMKQKPFYSEIYEVHDAMARAILSDDFTSVAKKYVAMCFHQKS